MVNNAHRINLGRPPLSQGLTDFFLFVEDDSDLIHGTDPEWWDTVRPMDVPI